MEGNTGYPAPQNEAFAQVFPHLVGHIGTHYDGCHENHPACAWRLGWDMAMKAYGVVGNAPTGTLDP